MFPIAINQQIIELIASTDGVDETGFCILLINLSSTMHMYCRFREPVVDLRFSRYPSFVCRCSFDVLNHPHLREPLLMLLFTVDQ
jgi:hypothetical protein